MNKLVSPILILLFLSLSSLTPPDYSGDVLLASLGLNVSSAEFKPVKEFWTLDKNLQSSNCGIKFTADSKGKIQSIFVVGENLQLSGVNFYKCTAQLPWSISLSDNVNTLNKKLGTGIALAGRSATKYVMEGVTVEVSFSGLANGKISNLKFYTEPKPVAPPKVTAEVKKEPVVQPIKTVINTVAKVEPKITPAKPVAASTNGAKPSPFKAALLDVFNAYQESNFYSVKADARGVSNFWNYQYTFGTRLKIPGEKFNMLYCFPFPTSSLDFVSVIKEADAFDGSFQTTYKEFEKKLLQSFPAADGWEASCIPNKESKTLSDLEFSNDKYGSIILDYSKNPKGKHILYLRFLHYSS